MAKKSRPIDAPIEVQSLNPVVGVRVKEILVSLGGEVVQAQLEWLHESGDVNRRDTVSLPPAAAAAFIESVYGQKALRRLLREVQKARPDWKLDVPADEPEPELVVAKKTTAKTTAKTTTLA